MPVVYACIVPASESASPAIASAVAAVAEELAEQQPKMLVVVASQPRPSGAIGVWAPEASELAAALRDAASQEALPVVERRASLALPQEIEAAVRGASPVAVTVARLEPKYHLDFGRALARALEADGRRTVLVSTVALASTKDARRARQFDAHHRRAIEEWSVRWLAGLDSETRRLAGEDAVAQTAVLMGALSRSRIQPRVFAYDDSSGAGAIVAVVDVLGPRRRRT